MTNQIQNPQEAQTPKDVSLEKRFGVEKDVNIEFDTETAVEKVVEKNASEKNASYKDILEKVKSKNDSGDEDALMQDASGLHQQTDRESQITHLVDLATTKGVEHAVKVAIKAEDYYVLDQLHDRLLADELHEALLSHGLIEDV